MGNDDANLQTIPIKLTLLDVPEISHIHIANFKNAMLNELKGMLSFLSSKEDGVGFTDVTEIYLDDARRERKLVEFISTINETQVVSMMTFHLYYDVTAAFSTKDENVNVAKRVIELMRRHHTALLQLLHEYKESYYYVDDFDVCAFGESGVDVYAGTAKDQDFDVCSYEHELIPVKFSALGLPDDLNIDVLQNELIEVYESILEDVDELAMGGLYAGKQVEKGDAHDFYFNVNVIQRDNRSMEQVITNALKSRNGTAQILSGIQNYTSEEALGIHWCITDSGQYSTQPCSVPIVETQKFDIATWQIITLTVSMLLLVCGFCIWICYVVKQRKKEKKELHYEVREFRRGRHYYEMRNARRHRRHSDRHRVRDEYERRRHHHRERRHRRNGGYDPRREERRRRHRSRHYTENSSESESEEPPLMTLGIRPPPIRQQQQLPQSRQQVNIEQGRYNLYPGHPPRHLPPLPQPEVLKIECPVYCDDEMVNRPDHLRW